MRLQGFYLYRQGRFDFKRLLDRHFSIDRAVSISKGKKGGGNDVSISGKSEPHYRSRKRVNGFARLAVALAAAAEGLQALLLRSSDPARASLCFESCGRGRSARPARAASSARPHGSPSRASRRQSGADDPGGREGV